MVAGAGPAGKPGVDVALGAGRQAGAVASQPGDQLDRRPDLVVHVVGLLGGDVVPSGLPAKPPQVMPGGEAAHDPAFGRVFDLAGLVRDPPLEFGEAFVPGGQDASGHQDLAQVQDGAAGRVAVERGVAGWLAGLADLGEDHPGGGARGQPLQQWGGVAGGQHVVDRLGVGMQAVLIMRQQAEEVLPAGAPGAQPVMVEVLGGPAFRAGLERVRVLAVTRAAQRRGGEPGGDGAGVAAAGAGHPLPAAGAAQGLAVGGACPHRPAVAAASAGNMAHPARAVLAPRRPGGSQVAGLLAAAQRAGGQRRPVAAAAPQPAVLTPDEQGGPPAAGALLMVGRVAAEAIDADRLAGHGAAGHRSGLPAAAAGRKPGLVVAAAAAAHRTAPEAQRDRPAA